MKIRVRILRKKIYTRRIRLERNKIKNRNTVNKIIFLLNTNVDKIDDMHRRFQNYREFKSIFSIKYALNAKIGTLIYCE